ncbi:hypothetical protein ACJRO7_030775 [Eucalyptus globulus]|uniref:ZF-HD dimerization-type domain-containing protein n=1 Tax=Eucalyptus globulus TaxID=34317 RepID=A0ABD3JK16_EUCGL
MPIVDEGMPEFFQCAACSCHRIFHRKEIVTHSGGEPESSSEDLGVLKIVNKVHSLTISERTGASFDDGTGS